MITNGAGVEIQRRGSRVRIQRNNLGHRVGGTVVFGRCSGNAEREVRLHVMRHDDTEAAFGRVFRRQCPGTVVVLGTKGQERSVGQAADSYRQAFRPIHISQGRVDIKQERRRVGLQQVISFYQAIGELEVLNIDDCVGSIPSGKHVKDGEAAIGVLGDHVVVSRATEIDGIALAVAGAIDAVTRNKVIPCSADEIIGTLTADKDVISVATIKVIGTNATIHDIVAGTAKNVVLSTAAVDFIIALAADNNVGTAATGDIVITRAAVDVFLPALAFDDVVAIGSNYLMLAGIIRRRIGRRRFG